MTASSEQSLLLSTVAGAVTQTTPLFVKALLVSCGEVCLSAVGRSGTLTLPVLEAQDFQLPVLGSALAPKVLPLPGLPVSKLGCLRDILNTASLPSGSYFLPPQQPHRRKLWCLSQVRTLQLSWARWGRAQHWQAPTLNLFPCSPG